MELGNTEQLYRHPAAHSLRKCIIQFLRKCIIQFLRKCIIQFLRKCVIQSAVRGTWMGGNYITSSLKPFTLSVFSASTDGGHAAVLPGSAEAVRHSLHAQYQRRGARSRRRTGCVQEILWAHFRLDALVS